MGLIRTAGFGDGLPYGNDKRSQKKDKDKNYDTGA